MELSCKNEVWSFNMKPFCFYLLAATDCSWISIHTFLCVGSIVSGLPFLYDFHGPVHGKVDHGHFLSWIKHMKCLLWLWIISLWNRLWLFWPGRTQPGPILPWISAVKHNFMPDLTARKIGMISQIISSQATWSTCLISWKFEIWPQ